MSDYPCPYVGRSTHSLRRLEAGNARVKRRQMRRVKPGSRASDRVRAVPRSEPGCRVRCITPGPVTARRRSRALDDARRENCRPPRIVRTTARREVRATRRMDRGDVLVPGPGGDFDGTRGHPPLMMQGQGPEPAASECLRSSLRSMEGHRVSIGFAARRESGNIVAWLRNRCAQRARGRVRTLGLVSRG